MNQVDLKVDFCSYQAAKFAVEHWHYSGVMPAGKTVKIGAWEDGCFIGAVIYSLGANNNIGKPYKLKQIEVCELVRVALTHHISPVSQIVSRAQKLLIGMSPGLRLIVSYADPAQEHHGGIYQALNWFYVGMSDNWRGSHYIINGKPMHGRTVRSKWGKESNIPDYIDWEIAPPANKHKYLYPLDKVMRRQIAHLAQPYPKKLDAPPVNGDNVATSHAGRFDPDPEAL